MADWFTLARPILHALDPERAHRLTIRALALGLIPAPHPPDDPVLRQRLWGLDFANPIGLAAGFDKHAEVVDAALGLGFGFVEIGGVTPLPQPGNPRPRLFRLAEDEAIVNRLGFNSEGAAAVARRLGRPRRRSGIVAVNLGKNRDTADAADDYAAGAAALAPFVDLLVINVSSPNTPGLRRLQARGEIERIVGRVRAAIAAAAARRPILLKIAPDLTEEDKPDIAAAALASGIDGLVVSNTTVARPPGVKSRFRDEAGGLSGRPLFAPSTQLLADMHRLTEGRLPLIGVGGIASGDDAYAKIRAGASLIQLYTALVYQGPGLIARIAGTLAARLRTDGFAGIAEAVGADRRTPAPARDAVGTR